VLDVAPAVDLRRAAPKAPAAGVPLATLFHRAEDEEAVVGRRPKRLVRDRPDGPD